MHYVITRINDDLFVSEIAKDMEILQATTWVSDAWKEVSVETIKSSIAKCGITKQTSENEDDIMDEEFNVLFNELTDSECDMTVEEYVDFDVETCRSFFAINSDIVHWRVSSFKAPVTEYLKKECDDLKEVASDNDGDKR